MHHHACSGRHLCNEAGRSSNDLESVSNGETAVNEAGLLIKDIYDGSVSTRVTSVHGTHVLVRKTNKEATQAKRLRHTPASLETAGMPMPRPWDGQCDESFRRAEGPVASSNAPCKA